MPERLDLTGQIYGYLQVISPAPNEKGHTQWNCICLRCGKERVISTASLRSGRVQSCGCLHSDMVRARNKAGIKDKTGKKYGHLTCIKCTGSLRGHAKWLCRCDCGNYIETDAGSLEAGRVRSCGCLRNSYGAQQIEECLLENDYSFKKEYSFEDLKSPKGVALRFDFAIFDDDGELQSLIEYDGEQHYSTKGDNQIFSDSLIDRQERDRRKNAYCLQHNIPLYRIPYWDKDKISIETLFSDTYLVKEGSLTMAAYEIFKWLKSENCSNEESKRLATKTRKAFNMTPKQYRKTLSWGREKTKVLETLMSSNRFDEIQFDSIPSRAGLIYKNAFARRDIIAKKYEVFAKDSNTKVNAQVLYPYEVINQALHAEDEIDRAMAQKYWDNLPDYFHGTDNSILAVIDTSASMTWYGGSSTPINVAIGLGMYCAERNQGPFHNTYISFSSRPQIINIEGTDLTDKARRIYRTNLCENTDLLATFELIRKIALQCDPEDIPKTIVVVSDMEIDYGACNVFQRFCSGQDFSTALTTEMEEERQKWEECGLTMPRLVYWNVQARHDNVLDWGPNISYVSGFSPVIFENIISGKTGIELMLDKLLSDRYKAIN